MPLNHENTKFNEMVFEPIPPDIEEIGKKL